MGIDAVNLSHFLALMQLNEADCTTLNDVRQRFLVDSDVENRFMAAMEQLAGRFGPAGRLNERDLQEAITSSRVSLVVCCGVLPTVTKR